MNTRNPNPKWKAWNSLMVAKERTDCHNKNIYPPHHPDPCSWPRFAYCSTSVLRKNSHGSPPYSCGCEYFSQSVWKFFWWKISQESSPDSCVCSNPMTNFLCVIKQLSVTCWMYSSCWHDVQIQWLTSFVWSTSFGWHVDCTPAVDRMFKSND